MGRKTTNWAKIREREFSLGTDYVYMNNSTFGATLNRVRERAQQVAEIFAKGCRLEQFAAEILPTLPKISQGIASLVNAGQTAEIGIVNSATEAMSLIANGLSFNPADIILLTNHEHTGNETMWQLQADRHGAYVRKISLIEPGETGNQWMIGLIERFAKAFADDQIKVMSVPWCTTSTGHILPVKELCALANKHGAISIVDATQLFGVRPLDFLDISCDFLVMNGHKYLGGPIGTGFIVARQDMIRPPRFFPTIVDINTYGDRGYLPCSKGGLLPYTNVVSLMEAIDFYQNLGPEIIHKRLLDVGQWLRSGLANNSDRINLCTPIDGKYACIMTCFKVNGMDSEQVVGMMRQNGIIVKESAEGGEKYIRISPHYWNTEEEYKHLITALVKVTNVDKNAWIGFPSNIS
jgi:selenocysteine lyase/cysteine desulfurase